MQPRCPSASNAAAWSGQADHGDRLPQRGLPRLVLHRPQILRDVIRLTYLARPAGKVIAKVSQALERALSGSCCETLPDKTAERGRNGPQAKAQRLWTWCFRASLYTLFKIDPNRSGDVLIAGLGVEFNGVLGL